MIKVAIYGYGNLGRGVEAALRQNPDMALVGVFSRRDPATVKTRTGAPVFEASKIFSMRDQIDVVILCGGSATDLPEQTPALASHFHVIDSFDTHAKIPAHYAAVDEAATRGGKIAVISVGWDPGLFSLARAYTGAILPEGEDYTFWGRGVSQGHSDAIRRIDGVLDARQYTVPVESALSRVRSGEAPTLTAREKHTRECFVVAKEGADLARIEREIKEMPNYFADYNTTVTFITAEEMKEKHAALPHGGRVIRTGRTGLAGGNGHTVEFSLALDSNPEFTASVLVAYARAAYRLAEKGDVGCKTVLDIPPALLSPMSYEDLLEKLL
ncbi:MAG: diaminopimelate dehydrogenase [Clostridia bacterium]|nr:diaminopimelate dehydrogenase [Clostridia bacterium]